LKTEFQRISRLPPYVFNIVNELKAQARAQGEDIIDFGMGNPDRPTPQHIVDKLVEVAQRENTHRYSMSKGIPRLRKAICDWYRRRYDVCLDPETEAIATIGSKEGLAHLALACVGPGDAILVPNPAYPIHPYGFIIPAPISVMCLWCRGLIFSPSWRKPSRIPGLNPRCWC
jgi:alanine-synthesizing transaminase